MILKKTDKGTIQGTFTYVHNSKGEKGYIFHPDIGDRWDVTLSADNSFTDKSGGVWRLQDVKVDQTPAVLEKHLQKIGG